MISSTEVSPENGATTGAGLLAVYGYDPLSRRTSITRGNGVNTGFGYDSDLRLSSLTHDAAGTAQDLSLGFTYTLASQLEQRTSSNSLYTWIPATTSKTYVPDALNRYTGVSDGVSNATFAYDDRGNLRSDGPRSFTYDVENHLLTETGGAGLTASYDPTGRLWQTISGTTTTQFLYAGDNLVAEYSTGGASGTVLRRYAHGPGTDEPIVWYEGSGLADRRWLLSDERGSIIAKADGTGVATAYTYGPYGEPSSWSVPRFAYTGQIALPEAKLYHYKARVYDPLLGRFLQTDPVGTKDDFNLYAYTGDDPINGSDPTGLENDPTSDNGNCGSRVGVDPGCTSVTFSDSRSNVEGHKKQPQAQTAQTQVQYPGLPVGVEPGHEEGAQNLGEEGSKLLVGGEVKAAATLVAGLKVLFRIGAKDIAKTGAKELLRDSTGKIHGTLPNAADLRSASPELIRHNVDELRGSILARQQELERLGEHASHRARIGEEESLLRSLEKRLEDMFGAKNE